MIQASSKIVAYLEEETLQGERYAPVGDLVFSGWHVIHSLQGQQHIRLPTEAFLKPTKLHNCELALSNRHSEC